MLLAHQAALVLALGAVAVFSARAARALGARGLELPVAAAPIGAAVAGACSLALGLFGLGGSPVALLAAALVLAGIAWRAWPESGAGGDLARWWAGLGQRERLVLGALAGAGLAWVAWVLRHPSLAIDPLTYHMPESIRWVQHGHPGRIEVLQYEFPQGNYPVTNELLVAWLTGLAWTHVPGLLWTSFTALVAVAAGFLALRRLGAGIALSALAIAAVLLTPIASTQLIGPHTDLPAIAWLWTAAALVIAAGPDRPALLAPAVLAAALSVGTKTTSAPLLVLLLGWALWRHRAALRSVAVPLGAATALAVAVGGVWYIRNLVTHGSPLWPFVAAPWGDPVPSFLDRLDVSFLDRPKLTLERNAQAYVDIVAGGWLVLMLGLAAPLAAVAARRRAVLLAFGATLLAGLSWLNAPFTGAADDRILDVSATTIRYLLPTLSAAAVALAVAAESRLRTPAIVALALACVWSIGATQDLPLVGMPSTATLVTGALAGIGAAWLLARTPRIPVAPALAAAAVLAVLGLAHVNTDFARRQSESAVWLRSSPLVQWAAKQPAFTDGEQPIAFAPEMISTLAGDRLEHEIELIGQNATCADVRARLDRGWIVLGTLQFADRREPFTADECLRSLSPRVLYRDQYYTVFAGS